MKTYLDANVIIPLFVPEATSARLSDWLAALNDRPRVSDLAIAECCAGFNRRIRTNELTREAVAVVLDTFDEWVSERVIRVASTPADIAEAALLVHTHFPKLLTPDAIHIATCRRLGLTLVSNDGALREVASREGVEAFGVASGED